jgi:hypothetical protein
VPVTGTPRRPSQAPPPAPARKDGRTATVDKPQAVYSGLESGHTYEVHIQPLSDGEAAGKAGVISFRTK